MNWWLYVLLFFVILFTYIHIQHQFKTGEDLEIYEYDYVSLKGLHDICQWKQPVLFCYEFPKPKMEQLESLEIKDIRDYKTDKKHIDSIQLSYDSARGLIETDTKGLFYSDRNVLHDSWNSWFKTLDAHLKPHFTIYSVPDVLYGSRKARTTSMYHRESHVYLYVPEETNKTSIRIKMTPAKSKTFLDPVNDYMYYECWSSVDLFEPHERMQCLDFMLKPGHVLYIPPYWFYSIEYQDKHNEVCRIKYVTGANCLANIKHISLYYLQQQNIHEKWWKPLENTDFDILPIQHDEEEVIDLSQNIVEEKDVVEELIDELKI
jgi:hypothetical protein